MYIYIFLNNNNKKNSHPKQRRHIVLYHTIARVIFSLLRSDGDSRDTYYSTHKKMFSFIRKQQTNTFFFVKSVDVVDE